MSRSLLLGDDPFVSPLFILVGQECIEKIVHCSNGISTGIELVVAIGKPLNLPLQGSLKKLE